MIEHSKFKVEDFAKNDNFIAWCLGSSQKEDEFWTNLAYEHPHLKEIMEEAKALVLDLQTLEMEDFTDNFEQEIWSKIDIKISKNAKHIPQKKNNIPFQFNFKSYAAAIALFCIGSLMVLQFYSDFTSEQKVGAWVNYENNSGLIKEISLHDGSTVVLEPFSNLKFPAEFTEHQRVVFLKGEAFFDIKRDTLKPFLVYANETITKVLGTSFRVAAFEGEKNVEVEVVTGKVAVYANVSSDKDSKKEAIEIRTDKVEYIPKPNKKLEILPNQKVVFDSKNANMSREVASLPILLTKIEDLPQFKFVNEPISMFFTALEKAYGIDLQYDSNMLEDCKITTELEDEPLFEKLNIICHALDLTYKQDDGKIQIEGTGCN